MAELGEIKKYTDPDTPDQDAAEAADPDQSTKNKSVHALGSLADLTAVFILH